MSTRSDRFFCLASRSGWSLFVTPFFLLVLLATNAASAERDSCVLPKDYGEVVCRYNEKSSNHLYVIGIAHRDSLTRSNVSLTPRVQAEVYKIGEWLIQNQEVELLLPEGFFTVNPKKRPEKKARSESLPTAPRVENMESLEQRLSDDRQIVNAEMLLKENFPLLLRQVEDRDLYQTVSENIRLLVETRANPEKSFLIRSELDYHQKRRVGAMLQKIPGIVNEEFQERHIGSKKALFTIGLSHLCDIIRYLEERKVTVLSPLFTPLKYDDYCDELNLAKEDFGISIIIPRTLINDREEMERNKLKVF